MYSLSPFAPVLRALLRDLLGAEYFLYTATRSALAGTSGRIRHVLESHTRDLDGVLSQVAWQLGTWGDCMLLDPAARGAEFVGPSAGSALKRLGALHGALVDRLNQFTARTSQLPDDALARMLADLRARHKGAAAALDHENRFLALPDDEFRFDPFPRSASFTPRLLLS